jgi:hypothetical protein
MTILYYLPISFSYTCLRIIPLSLLKLTAWLMILAHFLPLRLHLGLGEPAGRPLIRPPWWRWVLQHCLQSRWWAPSPFCHLAKHPSVAWGVGSCGQEPAVEVHCSRESLKLLQAARARVGQDGIHLHPQEDDDGTLCGRGNQSLYTKLSNSHFSLLMTWQ